MAGPEADLQALPRMALAQSRCVWIWCDQWSSKQMASGRTSSGKLSFQRNFRGLVTPEVSPSQGEETEAL